MTASYCRDVESYLCRRNDGHLIRLVGPAFELVCRWETTRIPLSVVCRAIDRTVERREAKGGRRRPVRIEFCEAEVLDLFDDWRRAVGVQGEADSAGRDADQTLSRRPSLVAHVDRVITRLTAWRGAPPPPPLRDLASRIVGELDSMRATAKTARGEARQRLMTRLHDVDRELMTAVRATADASLRDLLRAQAERDLAPFRQRMPPSVFAQSLEASTDRLFREHHKLPRIVFQ